MKIEAALSATLPPNRPAPAAGGGFLTVWDESGESAPPGPAGEPHADAQGAGTPAEGTPLPAPDPVPWFALGPGTADSVHGAEPPTDADGAEIRSALGPLAAMDRGSGVAAIPAGGDANPSSAPASAADLSTDAAHAAPRPGRADGAGAQLQPADSQGARSAAEAHAASQQTATASAAPVSVTIAATAGPPPAAAPSPPPAAGLSGEPEAEPQFTGPAPGPLPQAEGAAPASRQRTLLAYRAAALPAPALPDQPPAPQTAESPPVPDAGPTSSDAPLPSGSATTTTAILPAALPAIVPQDGTPAGLAAGDFHGPPAPARADSAAPAPPPASPPGSPPAAALLTAKEGEIDLRLAPEELGRVQMTLRQEGELMRVHIQADRPETLDLLRRNAGELASDLRAAGYEGSSFSFGGSPRGQDQRPAQTGTAAAEPAPLRPAPPAGTAGALDLRL